MRRDREAATDCSRDRVGQAPEMEKPCREDQQHAGREEDAGTKMAMTAPIRARVGEETDQGRRRDKRPLNPLVRRMPESKEGQEAGHDGHHQTVNGTGCRDGDSSAIPSSSKRNRPRRGVEHPATLSIRIAGAPRVLDRRRQPHHDRFRVLYEPSWGRLESFE